MQKNLFKLLGLAVLIGAIGLLVFTISSNQSSKNSQSVTNQSIQFTNPNHFSFDVTKVTFAESTGVTLSQPDSSATVVLLDPLPLPTGALITSFKEEAAKLNGTNITYQITTDLKAWRYFDGSDWVYARDCANCTNSAEEINENISRLPLASNSLQVKAFLKAGSQNVPILNSIQIGTTGGQILKATQIESNITPAYAHNNKINICHATGSENNPYVFLEVDEHSIDGEGNNDHSQHEGDIIPITDRNDDGRVDKDDCNSPLPHSTVVATKIVCNSESDLPNWGGGGANITATTASSYISSHSNNCHLESGWKFQWAPSATTNPGDNLGEVGNPWVAFGPTDNTGVAQTDVVLGNTGDKIRVREELKTGYIPFGYSNSNSSNSAEMYCGTDVNNYDNYETINDPANNHTYYCVAFNAQIPQSSWDHSNITTSGVCSVPSAIFTITNNGTGNMAGTSQYRVYRNSVLETTQTFQLTAGQHIAVTVAGNGDTLRIEVDQRPDNPNPTMAQATVTNCGTPPAIATVVATKIVCDVESDLPNWGTGGPDITNATAATFLSNHPHCRLQPNWQFQWAPATATDPGDDINLASNPWTTFGPTNALGVTQTSVNLTGIGDKIWLREALQPDYLGFGYSNGNNSTSAEFYCSKDVLNYDNFDFITTPTAGKTYHCIGFNVLKTDNTDHSNVAVDGVCHAPYAVFTITNTGTGNMTNSSQYRVYRNSVLENTQAFQLNAAASIVVSVAASGDTIRIEADQLPGHTGIPNKTISQCGTPNQPPIANDDSATSNVSSPVTVSVLDNDSDPDGTLVPSTTIITTPPTHGTITLVDGITGSITYTPDPDFYGSDTFNYQICDNGGLCDTAQVTINIKAPPLAIDDTITTPYQASVVIPVLANDSDPDGTLQPNTITIQSSPTNGTITNVNLTNGDITYQPNNGFTGADTFTYKICDNDGLCDIAMVAVSVNSKILHTPIARNDNVETPRDTAIVVDVLVNDNDSDGTLVPGSVSVTEAPAHGTITYINPTTGQITYTPTTGFSGNDQFKYQVCDDDGLCDTAFVIIHIVAPLPVAPVANDDSAITSQNEPIEISVLTNDYDTDGVLVPSTVTVISSPLNGSTNVNHTTGAITYSPNIGYSGTDSFTYQVCDNEGLCDSAIVSIAINPPDLLPPVAVNDTATTDQDTSVVIPVLTNDNDADGSLLPNTVHVTIPPAHGTITGINPTSGEITYLPESSFNGTDSFVYEVCDNDGLCDSATVTINVRQGITIVAHKIVCPNEADLPNWGTGGPDIDSATASAFLASHPDCSPMSGWQFQWGHDNVGNPGDNTGEAPLSSGYTTFGPTNGSGLTQVSLPASTVSSQIWMREVWQSGYIPFTYNTSGGNNSNNVSAEFYCNKDVLNFDNWDYINNISLGSTYYCVGFNVAEVPKLPPVAQDDATTTNQDTAITINVLNNDSDPDGTLVPSTVEVAVNPTNGSITSINPLTGEITYSPNTGFTGIDSFTYKVCDNDNLCDTAQVTIAIQPITVHLAPVANDDFSTTDLNTPVDISVLSNDTDADGTLMPATVTVTSPPTHGSTSVNTLTGQITYTPSTGFTGADYFTYVVCDNDGLCDSAIVSITVTPPPLEPPIANDDAATTNENTAVIIDILANDSDSDGTLTPSSVTVTVPPSNGSITNINVITGEITYTPNTNYTGLDTFTYQVCDNDNLCDTATVTIGVNNVPVPPVANNDSATTLVDTAILIPLLTNDLDIDGTLVPATTVIVSAPTNGVVLINGINGQATYTPNTGYSGTDSFTYKVCDNDNLCDTAIVTITINIPNVPPTPPITPPVTPLIVPLVTPPTPTITPTPVPAPVITSTNPLIFGANQFILSAQSQPLSKHGVLEITTNEPQTFYLEAKNATSAELINLDTNAVYPLIYNPDIKLWTGTFTFPNPGTFQLQGKIYNGNQNYSRPINKIVATNPSSVTLNGQPTNATITVFEKDIATGNFKQWNGAALAQSNPFPVENGQFSLILPRGEFYLHVEKPGSQAINSRIVSLADQGLVTANINLTSANSIYSQLFGRFVRSSSANNFALAVNQLPETNQLTLNQVVPPLLAHNSESPEDVDILANQTKPTVIMIYGNWNTLSQEQLNIFSQISNYLGSNYAFIPLSTMDPDAHVQSYLKRGNYNLAFYKPADSFFDKYFITSLPQFLFLNERKELLRSVIGPQSAESLTSLVQDTLGK